jgi:hypothetical protein
MKDTLLYLTQAIVTHPDEIKITQTGSEDHLTLTLSVHKDDMGKIIGKQGRIIRALRDLIKLIAAKKNIFVDVILSESEIPEKT